MAGQLFHSTKTVDFDMCSGVFHQFLHGWILPTVDLHKGDELVLSATFIKSMLNGQFVERNSQRVGFYFSSGLSTYCNGACLTAYAKTRAGMAKKCNRVYADDDLVILEFPTCGVMALSPKVNSFLGAVFEEQ